MISIRCLLLFIFLFVNGADATRICYPVNSNAPIYQAFGEAGHVGVDLVVRVGTPVRAVLGGIAIETAEDSPVYGRYLMVLHSDGYVSLYGHLSKLLVRRGDRVQACDVIALSGGDPHDYIGGDGLSSGAHLHLEVRPPGHSGDNDHNVDPMEYIRSHRRAPSGRQYLCI